MRPGAERGERAAAATAGEAGDGGCWRWWWWWWWGAHPSHAHLRDALADGLVLLCRPRAPVDRGRSDGAAGGSRGLSLGVDQPRRRRRRRRRRH
eukprot:6118790-Prymnesium_polylepis.1